MNLILWRHAEAEDQAASDLVRQLTPRGRKQAQAVAKWLQEPYRRRRPVPRQPRHAHDPDGRSVRRPLSRRRGTRARRQRAGRARRRRWPEGIAETVVVVGHQPTLGHVASLLLTGDVADWSVKKAGVWWFQQRARGGDGQIVLRAVTSPDLL